MKKIILLILCCALCTFPHKSHAQVLKKIGKKIERSVERRVERKVDQGIEKGLDKAEEGTENVVEGAIAGDGTASNKTGANGNSAIKSLPDDYQIKISGSGPELFMEYRMHVDGPDTEASQMNMSMQMYASPKTGKGRAETVMEIPMMGEMRMAVLTDMNNPEQIIMLNERRKQYSVMDLSDVNKKQKKDEVYQVKKLGTVNFRGLNCIHSEAINQDGERFEIWTTTEIPGYQDMVDLYAKSQQMGTDNLWAAMQDAGSAGFMVKFQVEQKGTASILELVEIQKTSVPPSTFEIPDGYKESKGGWLGAF